MTQFRRDNFAYIDSQNLHLGIKSLGWSLDFSRFRIYLKEKYGIAEAYLFIGYIEHKKALYKNLAESGFLLKFKPTLPDSRGSYKGNIDTDLVLQAVSDTYENKFDKAILVTSDGDFYCLVDFLKNRDKLLTVLSPLETRCSSILKNSAGNKIYYLNNLRKKLAQK